MQQAANKDKLHSLVDALPDEQLDAALRVLAALAADPMRLSLLTAQFDDEPYTAEQQKRDMAADTRIERGEGIPHEEILKEYGL